MNELGHVVGEYFDCNEDARPFIWTSGSFVTPLSIQGAERVEAINSTGHIAGTRTNGNHYEGFLYVNGVTTDLGMPPGANYQEGLCINERNQICGYTNNVITGPLRAFIWQNSRIEYLNIAAENSTAYAISDNSQITGWMGVTPNPPFYGEAYIWSDGVTVPLGHPRGGLNSFGRAINNFGDVCGHYIIPAPNGPNGTFVARACLWSKGAALDLGVFPGHPRSIAYDLNDHGEIVGACDHGNLVPEGFIWRNGVMSRLNDLVPPEAKVIVREGRGINNSGQIAAFGRDLSNDLYVALRLTPIPIPPGDCDCNGQVGIQDLLNAIGQWGPAIPTTTADFNNDGTVNVADVLIVIGNWD